MMTKTRITASERVTLILGMIKERNNRLYQIEEKQTRKAITKYEKDEKEKRKAVTKYEEQLKNGQTKAIATKKKNNNSNNNKRLNQ